MKNKTICFSQVLKEIRLQNRMTQKELARRLDIPVSTYRGYEYGNKFPAELIPLLSLALEISVNDIFQYFDCFNNKLKGKNSPDNKENIENAIRELNALAPN